MTNRKAKVIVIGAGVSGLAAASWLKKSKIDFEVYEGNADLPKNLHNGVHYLHSMPYLPFQIGYKKMTLTDGMLVDGKIQHTPNLEQSLLYSKKVREFQHPSSIMNIGKSNSVYMPESNSVNTLLEECYEYAGTEKFHFNHYLESIDTENKIATFQFLDEKIEVEYEELISTIPLNIFKNMVDFDLCSDLKLESSPVHITNYEVEKIVPNWLINLYIPDPKTPIYRASILNGICSVESTRELTEKEKKGVKSYLHHFYFKDTEPTTYNWNTGKVISINTDNRAILVKKLKSKNIYQIGRFGLWNRKLLIDSSVQQAESVVGHIQEKNIIHEEDNAFSIFDNQKDYLEEMLIN